MTVNMFLDQRLLERIGAEYLEMPGMKLTTQQVQRLCGIEEPMCTVVLDSLVRAKFLCLNADGTYVRVTEGKLPLARAVKATVHSKPFATTTRRAS
jgi:hypothetical protein